jgi:ABC-type antimicrobial peptide transport system permease subunit
MNSVILNDKYFEIEKIGKSSIIGFSNDVNGQITCVGKWTFSAESLANPGVTNYYGYNMPEGQSPILGSYGITANNTELVKRYSRWDNSTFGRYPITDNEIVISYKLVNKLFNLNWTMYNNGAGYDYYVSRQHVRMWEQINGKEITITLNGYKGNDTEYTKTYKVVGITDTMEKVGGYSSNVVQVTPSEYQNIYYSYNTFEQKILVELPNNSPEAYNLFNRALNAGYVIDVWAYQQDIDTYIVDPFLDLASKAGLFIFAIFTMGIMWTIISIEIVDSKKEIGILRSIGLSGGKVAFIFIFQAASVVFLAYFLGVYGGYTLVPYLNIGITDELGKITLFMYSFTERTPIYLALLVIAMTAISTAIPLFKILSQKIIDVINERDN